MSCKPEEPATGQAGKTGSSRDALGAGILQNCRNELYSYFPFLDGAFASVSYGSSQDIRGIATEGDTFYFQPDFLITGYIESPARIRRGYLHMMLHCLYLHLFPGEGMQHRLWDLACDIAVEQVIQREDTAVLRLPPDKVRERCCRQLGCGSVSAQRIYGMLEKGIFADSLQDLEKAFHFDDHSLWYLQPDKVKTARMKSKWSKVLGYTGQKKHEQKRRAGTQKGGRKEAAVVHKSRYDYKRFLKRFAVPREEVELDTESFDYIYYHYGMEHYGNMPLIEPLEYREVNRLEELVIAVDTSGSCSKETVQQFLAETYSILSERENFFKKMQVYLLQCDCCVQEAVCIHSEEEWKNYSKDIKIQGRGGTDFRPVFSRVNELREKKVLRNLRALIYFTDGEGIYPKCKPEYETAFVFLEESPGMDRVPPWALKLIVPRCGC